MTAKEKEDNYDLHSPNIKKHRLDDVEAQMSFLDPYFSTWFKSEKGISQFVDDKLTNKIFDKFHTRIKLWNTEKRIKYRKEENDRTGKMIQKINENIAKHTRSSDRESANIRKLFQDYEKAS